MTTMTALIHVVKSDPIHAEIDAVRAGRAEWRSARPIDAMVAVYYGEASWLADRPRVNAPAPAGYGPPPVDFTLIDDRDPEPPLEAQYNPAAGPTPFEPDGLPVDPTDLRDDEAYVPSEEDQAWYLALCREREERLWAERVLAEPTFAEQLYAEANRLIDSPEPVQRWLGEQVAKLADMARWLDANGPESYEERLACLQDARGR